MNSPFMIAPEEIASKDLEEKACSTGSFELGRPDVSERTAILTDAKLTGCLLLC